MFLFKTLKKDVTSQIFSYLPHDKQETLIQTFTGPQIREMLDELYDDDIIENLFRIGNITVINRFGILSLLLDLCDSRDDLIMFLQHDEIGRHDRSCRIFLIAKQFIKINKKWK